MPASKQNQSNIQRLVQALIKFYRRLNFFSVLFFSLQMGFLVVFSFSTTHKNYTPVPVENEAPPPEVQGLEEAEDGRILEVNFFVFVGQGMLMSFLRKYSFSSVGFSFLCANIAMQWGVLVSQFYKRLHCANLQSVSAQGCPWTNDSSMTRFDNLRRAQACICPSWSDPVQLTFGVLLEGNLDAVSTLITFGALLGKVSPMQLQILGLSQSVLYGTNRFLVELSEGAVDSMGGAVTIHLFGALFGLAASYIISNKESGRHPDASSRYSSDLYAWFGAVWLWITIPSFNSATAPSAFKNVVVLNTMLALIVATPVAAVTSSVLHSGKFSAHDIQHGALAGAIVVGSPAIVLMTPATSMLVGSIGAIVAVAALRYLHPMIKDYDTLGVTCFHAIPGLIGGIVTIMASLLSIDNDVVTPIIDKGDILTVFPRADVQGDTWRTQVLLLFAAIGVSVGGGLATGLLVRYFESHTTLNTYSDSAFWDVPDDFRRVELENAEEVL